MKFTERLSDEAYRKVVLLVIIYAGFISLGLPDTILGVSWNQMRADFGVPVYYAGFLNTFSTVFSALSAVLSGMILRWLGVGKLLSVCAVMTGLAVIGTALAPAYWVLVLLSIPLGMGQGAIDSGMNFYVAHHYTSRDMNWLHCCWGVGATVGPALITSIMVSGGSWRWGYASVGVIQILLGVVFLLSLKLWGRENTTSTADAHEDNPANKRIQYSLRLLSCPAMFFLYCGIEFSFGLWGYEFLTTIRGVSDTVAGYAVAGYWAMLTIGRFLLGIFANRIGNFRLIRCSMILAITGCGICLVSDRPQLTIGSVGLIGFAFSSFYPSMMHASAERFNPRTAALVIGWQSGAGMLGAAIVPAVFGYVAARTSFAYLPVTVLCIAALLLVLHVNLDGWRKQKNRE